MYETALLQGQPAPNAAEFNTYAFIMLLVGARQKDALAAFFQVICCCTVYCPSVSLTGMWAVKCAVDSSAAHSRQHACAYSVVQ